MALSIQSALRVGALAHAKFEVSAGQNNLDTPVRWVHSTEDSDVARFLKGGEMILTSGRGIGSTPAQQRTHLREIRDAGAAALLLAVTGQVFTSMPAGLTEEATRLGFPLIALLDDVSFVEASAQILELIISQQESNLPEFEKLNARFIELLHDGQDHVALVQSLAHQVGSPVALEDIDHNVVAYAGATSSSDSELANWFLHVHLRHHNVVSNDTERRSAAVSRTGEPETNCSRRGVVLRGKLWGWLHCLRTDFSPVDSYAFARAADAITIALRNDSVANALAAQRRNNLINRLLLGDLGGDEFINLALKSGIDMRNRTLVVIAVSRDVRNALPGISDHDSLLPADHGPRVTAELGHFTIAVVGLTPQISEQHLVDHLRSRGERAGLSRRCKAAGLPGAIRQARSAVLIAATRPEGTVMRYDRLGVQRLFVALAESDELARFVDDELGAILDHDVDAANPLLETLRVYLACDGNKARTSEQLYVQRRTLYNRLERLDALLDRSMEEPEVRQDLAIAVRALDFINSRPRTESLSKGAHPHL